MPGKIGFGLRRFRAPAVLLPIARSNASYLTSALLFHPSGGGLRAHFAKRRLVVPHSLFASFPYVKSVGPSPSGPTLRLSTTKTNRSYTIEQRDGLDTSLFWYDILPLGQGTGGPLDLDVPLPWNDQAFWRVRV